ncbi:hypothetical protein E2562_023768 [Oryza meyeriana var. granulata]|uniref:Uncharacterized protein n=1 Tax=Oryza meyeriana var. granulata TaxID=110450 RepID=A0A6G1DMJ7_9ORYZ|nr:hypothetical protein E2562_023768 [Oryza meyeriana var. granulata]
MRSDVSRAAPARPASSPGSRASRAAAGWATFGRGAVPGRRLVTATTLRARCGGGTEPVEARKDGEGPGKEGEGEAAGGGVLAVAEELEVLEEAAMGGGDEGRRPTDYDRRAHMFEESSRVFSALKHRHDDGADAAADTARHADSGR